MSRFWRALRALARLAALAPATLAAYLSALLGWPLGAFGERWRVRWQGGVFQLWSRALCRILGVRVAARGPVPRPPFVLVSNHLSYLDIIVLGTRLPCVFVAKAEIDAWPVFGALCRSVGTIFIERQAKRRLPEILGQVERALEAGQGVVIFPEGTSGAGDVVLPFRSSLLDLPARLDRPVHHATLGYRSPDPASPTHLTVTWWGEMPLGPHLRALLDLPWIEATLDFGGEAVRDTDRKRLAESLHAAVRESFRPVVSRAEVERLLRLKEEDPDALPPVLRTKSERFG